MSTWLLGCHLSISGGLDQAVARAGALRINALQIFSHNARSWRMGLLRPGEVEKFTARCQQSQIQYMVIHTIYLINLASPDPRIRELSVRALRDEMHRAGELNIPHVNTHLGAHMGQGVDAGLQRVVEAIGEVLASPEARRAPDVKILLENSAGEGTELGVRFEELGFILHNIQDRARVGVCVDTCHALCAGYDLATSEGLEQTLKELDRAVGLQNVELVHVNDSKFPLGSRRDRHEHIGQGSIGLEGFRLMVNHQALREKPFILETPKDDDASDLTNLSRMRSLRYDDQSPYPQPSSFFSKGRRKPKAERG